MTAPPEPLRSEFLQFVANHRPWFHVGRDVMFHGRRLTIRRIDLDSWSFHTSEPQFPRWLRHSISDVVTRFVPAESPLDDIEKHLDE